ncbi:MAG: type II toxin-antitoxin system HicB family antitoxin [Acaryochloris sp. RU_4_1]|nr:type II toxin-antitoxin system HicB family antitoxin [Acaryochloris sp. RU_4_1]
MKYKGYESIIEFDAEDRIFFGRVLGTHDVIAFDGQTVDELETSFRTVVDEYLADCQQVGKNPDQPCSGRFNLRISPELHRRAVIRAQTQGISLNALVEQALTQAL